MNNLPMRNIICIDLKSFFASVECVERKLDPFTTPLVVCSSNKGAITLAVTPYLKAQGIGGRTRLYDIPKNIKYIKVPPRMSLYIKKSTEVINIYLNYVSEEDLHIYSIDECFLDLTNYLKLYQKSDYEIAEDILKEIERKTGLTATCGIGPNMLIAKVAMDTEAKKHKNGICKWTYEDIPSKFYPITPLHKFWGIGLNMEKRLNRLGINSIGDLARYNQYKLKDEFGILGLELYNHANGIDYSRISDYKTEAKDKSFSHSQVLFKDYNGENIKIIISEMLDTLCTRLRKNNYIANQISLGITYSKNVHGGFYHASHLDKYTDNHQDFYAECLRIFNLYYSNEPIRKVSIAVGHLTKNDHLQLDLFNNNEQIINDDKVFKVVDQINEKLGKNSVLKATSLLNDSTIKERNQKIGGHHE